MIQVAGDYSKGCNKRPPGSSDRHPIPLVPSPTEALRGSRIRLEITEVAEEEKNRRGRH